MALGYGKGITGWQRIKEKEKIRAKGFEIIKEYPKFYLCGKIKDGEILYRECFARTDVDSFKAPKPTRFRIGYHKV